MKIKWDYEEGAALPFDADMSGCLPEGVNLIAYVAKQFVLRHAKRAGSLYDYAYVFVACNSSYYRVDPVSFQVNEMFEDDTATC